VLFAEVAAPTGLAGTLGLEALRDLVGGSLATVIAEVEALGGTVTSVSGRGLQAMFGAPEAHEDDPERAVRAAYRAMSATAAAATAAATAAAGAADTLGLRIGVESGPAVVGPTCQCPTSRPSRSQRQPTPSGDMPWSCTGEWRRRFVSKWRRGWGRILQSRGGAGWNQSL